MSHKIKKEDLSESQGAKIFIITSIITVVALVIGLFAFMGGSQIDNTPTSAGDVVENGKQVITINAKNGYSPNNIQAKAGMPTILRFATKNTIDCSTALVINQLGITKSLPATGTTDIEVPAQTSGSTVKGNCSMAMYSFEVKFI